MPEGREMYRGREIVVTTHDGAAELLIDDRRVEVSYLEALLEDPGIRDVLVVTIGSVRTVLADEAALT